METISLDRLFRTRVSLFKEGKNAAADLLKQSTEYSPSRHVLFVHQKLGKLFVNH